MRFGPLSSHDSPPNLAVISGDVYSSSHVVLSKSEGGIWPDHSNVTDDCN